MAPRLFGGFTTGLATASFSASTSRSWLPTLELEGFGLDTTRSRCGRRLDPNFRGKFQKCGLPIEAWEAKNGKKLEDGLYRGTLRRRPAPRGLRMRSRQAKRGGPQLQ